MTDTATPPADSGRPTVTFQWKELYDEVITSGLCTGCAGCVIACPHDVIGYEHEPGAYTPFHLEDELGPSNCTHGEKGCTSCTRACPRFRNWETEADDHLFGRTRQPDEMSGIYSDILLVRAKEDAVYDAGQDGGLVSAILIWCLDNGIIDGALVSMLEGGAAGWKAVPGVATNREEVLAGAGSRYTYSANTIAFTEAMEKGLEDLALVGMSCQTSIAPVMWHRKVGKVSRPDQAQHRPAVLQELDDSLLRRAVPPQVRPAQGGDRQDEHQGRLPGLDAQRRLPQINLKECHAWTREGCNHCPDFAAEHADISTGGIGDETDWTLTIVRTELGRAIVQAMLADGSSRPGPATTTRGPSP